MKQSLFDTLARSRIVRSYEESFKTATGFVVKLLPVTGSRGMTPFGTNANPFCSFMYHSPQVREICKQTFAEARSKAADTLAPSRSCCFAGFTHIAIPVISAGEHVATIYGGQLMLETPTKAGFNKLSRKLVRLGLGDYLPSLEQAWLNTPVITGEQLVAITYLLETFAARISRYVVTRILEPSADEPVEIAKAREYIQERYSAAITLADVALHLRMSQSTFGKLFKRTVGLTFTQYLTRLRVEQAKSMLANPNAQIQWIASETGFDSISQFNRSFRHYADLSPTQYRASLEGNEPVTSPSKSPSTAGTRARPKQTKRARLTAAPA